jgi:predicted RNA-binding protein YlxR (DUF448 family)
MEIDGTILKGIFSRRRLKRFKQRGGYLFLDSKEEGKEEGKREVKRDLSSNNSQDELGDLVKEVEFIKGIEAKGEVLA